VVRATIISNKMRKIGAWKFIFNRRVICTISTALPCRCLVLPSDHRFHNNGLYSIAYLYKSYHYISWRGRHFFAVFPEKLAAIIILWCWISRKKMCSFVHSLFYTPNHKNKPALFYAVFSLWQIHNKQMTNDCVQKNNS